MILKFIVFYLFISYTYAGTRDTDTGPVTITSVSTVDVDTSTNFRAVSMMGNTRIWIRGTGFSLMDPFSNVVLIGPNYICDIVEIYTTPIMVVCETRPMDEGVYTISVIVDGKRTDSCHNCITVTRWATPRIEGVIPSAGNAGQNVTFKTVPFVNSTKYIDMYVGEYRCNNIEKRETAPQDLRKGSSYFLNCTVGELPVGRYSITLRGLMSAGDSMTYPGAIAYDYEPNELMNFSYTVVPQISSINPSNGSRFGQEIIINGNGFGDDAANITVHLDDLECTIKDVNKNRIICDIGQDTRTNIPPVKVGGVGAISSIWLGVNSIPIGQNKIDNPDFVSLLLSTETIPGKNFSYYTERISGFFTPPENGNYTFMTSSVSSSQLWFSNTTNSMDRANLNQIANKSYVWSDYRQFYLTREPFQQSLPIELVAGQNYYYEFWQISNSNLDETGANPSDWATLAVRIPNTENETLLNSVSTIQKLNIVQDNLIYEQYSIKITTLAGSLSIVFPTLSNGITTEAETGAIAWNASPTTVKNILSYIGYYTQVDVVYYDSDNFALPNSTNAVYIVWTINYTTRRKNNRPPYIKLSNGISANMNKILDPSAPITGTFSLSLNNQTNQFSYLVQGYELAAYLETIPGIKMPVFVTRDGDPRDNVTWVIDFAGNPGESIPEIDVNSVDLIAGSSGTVTVDASIIREASDDLIFAPIPYNLINVPDNSSQITLNVNGIGANCPYFNCDYGILPDSEVPFLVQYTWDATNNNLMAELNQTDNFDQNNFRLNFGGTQCLNPSVNPTTNVPDHLTISCTFTEIVSGDYIPQIYTGKVGNAIYDQLNSQSFSPVITTVDPSEGSTNGGTEITITGQYFGLSLNQPFNTQVSIGGSPCQISSLSNTEIVCMTTTQLQNATDSNLIVSVNNKSTTSTNLFNYNNANAPTVTSVSPGSASPVLYSTLTINGQNFGSNAEIVQVTLINKDSNGPNFPCYIDSTTFTNTNFQCKITGGKMGNYTIQVKVGNIGNSIEDTIDSALFSLDVYVQSISPTSGSRAGGTNLTITGVNFSPNLGENQVTIGDSLIECVVLNYTTTQLICITEPTDSEITSPQDVTVLSRIVEIARCPNNNCQFTFDPSRTPNVTSVTPLESVAGNNLTITGIGFSNLGSIDSPEVKLGGDVCNTLEYNDTVIICKITNSVAKKYLPIIVYIPNIGNAAFTTPMNFTSSLLINSITPTTISQAGALITINGGGFSENTQVNIGNHSCQIISVVSSIIECLSLPGVAGPVSFINVDNDCENCSITLTTNTNIVINYANTPNITSINSNNFNAGSSFSINAAGVGFQLLSGTPSAFLSLQIDSSIEYLASVTSTDSSLVASFANIPAGIYNFIIQVSSVGYAKPNPSVNTTITIALQVTSQSFTGSFAGGFQMTMNGNGFSPESEINRITICGFLCPIVSSNYTQINFTAPPLVTTTSQTVYGLVTPNLLTANWVTDNEIGAQNVTDYMFSSSYLTNNTNCFITADFGEDLQVQLQRLKYFPAVEKSSKAFIGSRFEGSNDNITWTLVYQVDSTVHDGWNYWTPSNDAYPEYRYIRYTQGTSNSFCNLAEIQIYGIITYNQDSDTQCDIKFNVGGQIVRFNNTITYSDNLTPVLNDFTPKFGTAAGGTLLTLNVSGITPNNQVTITIDTIECQINNIATIGTITQINCTTGAALPRDQRPSSIYSTLIVNVDGMGYAATNNSQYLYVESWSDPNTWGGVAPPRDGDSVYVPPGLSLLVDQSSPKLKSVIVEGALIFADNEDMTFDSHYIIVKEGRLQIGTPETPYTHNLIITLWGDRFQPKLPTFGDKVLALMDGILDIHGIPRKPTWTVLAQTAQKGDTIITLLEPVDWQVNEMIIIASTESDQYQSEERKIISVSTDQLTLTLDRPLVFKHLGVIQTYGNQQVHIRAEVGLLSRNVIVQGDPSSNSSKHGAQIMVHNQAESGNVARISYTEVRYAGQAFLLGRYPIHFHMSGIVDQSFVLGNAIHHTFNRAVTIHGVHYLTFKDNVCYRVMGHSVFIEDGIETHNLIQNNLVINTMASWSLLNTDQTPSSFWMTHPNNMWIDNHAAGSDRYGFWLSLDPHPIGPSSTDSVCPRGEKLGIFKNNVAHSNGKYGLRIFENFAPRTYPCLPARNDSNPDPFADNPPITAYFEDSLFYKNFHVGVIGEEMGDLRFKNITTIDNIQSGFELTRCTSSPIIGCQIESALVVGQSNDADEVVEAASSFGIITAQTEYLRVNNVKFYNFQDPKIAIGTCSHCEDCVATDSGARTTHFSGLSFTNVNQIVKFKLTPLRDILKDIDGTLSGAPNNTVTFAYPHLEIPECTVNTTFNGTVCNSSVEIRRVVFYNALPDVRMKKVFIKILRIDPDTDLHETNVSKYSTFEHKSRKEPSFSWALPLATGYTYKLHWRFGQDWDSIRMETSPLWDPNDKPIIILMNHSEYRETYDVIYSNRTGSVINITNTTTLFTTPAPINGTAASNPTRLLDTPNLPPVQFGDWYHDVNRSLLYLNVNGLRPGWVDLTAYRCKLNCPKAMSDAPKEDFMRRWSNATMWPNQTVPVDGQEVVIQPDWVVLLDVDTAHLGGLEIQGNLIFDDTRNVSKIISQKIWVRGNLIAGNETNRFPGIINITLTGGKDDPQYILAQRVPTGNKVLAVTGRVQLYGNFTGTVWTRLSRFAPKGSTQIEVNNLTGWEVGGQIVIATTDFMINGTTTFWTTDDGVNNSVWNSSEFRTIIAINGSTITLDSPLVYNHLSSIVQTEFGTIDISAEVGYLTRNIKIQGTSQDGWGGWIIVTQLESEDVVERGNLQLYSVEMINTGQFDTAQAAITFQFISESPETNESVVRDCAIYNSNGKNVYLESAYWITIYNNVFFRSIKCGIMLEPGGDLKRINISNNLILENAEAPDKDPVTVVYTALLQFFGSDDIPQFVLQNNSLAGCFRNCIVGPAGGCNGNNDIKHNMAHSGEVGWVVAPNATSTCLDIKSFYGYGLYLGVVSYFSTKSIHASNIMVTDSIKGISLTTGFNDSDLMLFTINNSYFAGQSFTGCANQSCYESDTCSNMAGIQAAYNSMEGKSIPTSHSKLPWDRIKFGASFYSYQYITNVTFANFQYNQNTGCINNFAFITNMNMSDWVPPIFMTGIRKYNVPDNSLAYIHDANLNWIGQDDCGNWPCTGILNTLIKDTDGSFTGDRNVLIPNKPLLTKGAVCTFNQIGNHYKCNSSSTWAVLAWESLDSDNMTRIITPINVTNTDGFRSDINTMMDNSWNTFYTGLLRPSRWLSLVQLFKNTTLNYTGSLPQIQRFQLQAASNTDAIKIQYVYYESKAVRVEWENGTVIVPTVVNYNETDQLLKFTDPCGKHIYTPSENKIQFILTGELGCIVKVRTTNSVRCSARYDMSIEDFYSKDGQTKFVDRVAAVLGIPIYRIRIVSVRKGSAVIDFYVDATNQTADSSSASGAQTELNNLMQTLTAAQQSGSLVIEGASLLDFTMTPVINSQTNNQTNNPTNNQTNNPNNQNPEAITSNSKNSGDNKSMILAIVLGVCIPIIVIIIAIVIYFTVKKHKEIKVLRVSPELEKVKNFDGKMQPQSLSTSYDKVKHTEISINDHSERAIVKSPGENAPILLTSPNINLDKNDFETSVVLMKGKKIGSPESATKIRNIKSPELKEDSSNRERLAPSGYDLIQKDNTHHEDKEDESQSNPKHARSSLHLIDC